MTVSVSPPSILPPAIAGGSKTSSSYAPLTTHKTRVKSNELNGNASCGYALKQVEGIDSGAQITHRLESDRAPRSDPNPGTRRWQPIIWTEQVWMPTGQPPIPRSCLEVCSAEWRCVAASMLRLILCQAWSALAAGLSMAMS